MGADEGGEAAQQANPPDGAREMGKAREVEEVFELAVDSVSPLIGRGGTRVKELALPGSYRKLLQRPISMQWEVGAKPSEPNRGVGSLSLSRSPRPCHITWHRT